MASKDLSNSITHFRYSTKRKNRYFFSAWINRIWTGIILDLENEKSTITFNGEPNKKTEISDVQKNMIYEECIKELQQRKILVEGRKK